MKSPNVYPFEYQRRVLFDQNFDFKIWKEHQKISYDRHTYESVDVRSLFWVYGKQYSGSQRDIEIFGV